jgi:pre-mRNA-processing factor 39
MCRLFERGSESAGLDFLAHPLWDKYIDFEERSESQDSVFALLSRLIHIPLHQYARYFERYRTMALTRPINELAPADVIQRIQAELTPDGSKNPEKELRTQLAEYHMTIFKHTQEETTKRWAFESEIKRPYYHVTELDDAQLINWEKYLDFEEAEGGYVRTKFLYERCLVTAANYEYLWLRYARWMYAQPGKHEEVRNILQRASCLYVPVGRSNIRLFYAQFEEVEGRPESA